MGDLDDDIVELRFSTIDIDAEQLMDVISEEMGEMAEEYVDAVAEMGHQRGPNTARRLSAIALKKDSNGRNSVLSVRPSLLSLGMSDRLLEMIMENSSIRSLNSSLNSVFEDSEIINGAQNALDDFLSAPMPTQSSGTRRISITADPLLFGAGGAVVPMDANDQESNDNSIRFSFGPAFFTNMEGNNDSTSFEQPFAKKPCVTQFSVSRSTLQLFDDEFNTGSSTSSIDSGGVDEPKPVNVVSNELRQTYLHETDQISKVQENALSMEMNTLSFADKDRVNFEVHGIPHMGNLDQEPENIDEYLQELERELQNTTRFDDPIREAQRMNPTYVNSKEFRLMFLRMFLKGKIFDVQQAAAKMVLHFSTKKLIFGGGEILGRDVRLSDLSKDDRAAMDSGAWQTMPDRDVARRVVVFYAPGQRTFKNIENWMRAMWYMFYIVAKDQDNQKSGMVMVVYLRGFTDQRDTFEEAQKITLVRDAMPQKFVGLHYCYNDPSLQALVTAQKVHFLTRNQRSHSRDHLASHDEICFTLETYGIYVDKKILLANGHLGLEWYNQWVKLREVAEEDVENTGVVESTIVPGKFDVLFGRGRNTREHCGNLRCAHLVEMHQIEYEACSKLEKTALAERIVDIVKDCGGRFLKKDRKKGWEEVPDTMAREKVAHFFRHLRAIVSTQGGVDNGHEKLGPSESHKRPAPCLDAYSKDDSVKSTTMKMNQC